MVSDRDHQAATVRASPVLEQAQPAAAVGATAAWCTGAAVWWEQAHAEWATTQFSRNRA